jgi:hypothetical protein
VLSRFLTLLQGWWEDRYGDQPSQNSTPAHRRIEPTITYRPPRQPR